VAEGGLERPLKCEKVVTVYFDTARSKLREHGLVLRVRHAGENRLQTIKADKKGARGLFGRDEWEEEIESDMPNLKLAHRTALEPLVTKRLEGELKPIFETVVERTTFPIHTGETDLEVAVDHGYIEEYGRREPISEIEIELKNGDPNGIMVVADRLARAAPITYAARSKAERGYALSADQAAKPVRAAMIHLDPEVSTADAFQAVALSCDSQREGRPRGRSGGHPPDARGPAPFTGGDVGI